MAHIKNGTKANIGISSYLLSEAQQTHDADPIALLGDSRDQLHVVFYRLWAFFKIFYLPADSPLEQF